jgi:hypothetical protein
VILAQQFRCNFENLEFCFQLPNSFLCLGQLDTFWSRRPRSLASINLILTNPVMKCGGADSLPVHGSGERFARAHKRDSL